MTVRVNKPSLNIREKLSELERPIGLKGGEIMGAETAQEVRDLVSAGRKNLIINGDFKISQRGNYTSSTNMAHNTYYLDRWVSDHGNTVTATFRQITTDLPKQYRNETNNGLRFEATSSNSSAYLGFRQRYEFMSHLDGKFVTVSAWVKSNRPAVIINYDGSGAPYDYAQHSGSGQWEYLSYTTFIDSTSYNHFDIFLINPITYSYVSISSGDYVEVTNYQLEVGKNATEFEHRSYGEELALCQRYYQVHDGHYLQVVSSATGHTADFYTTLAYWVPMRDTPDVTESYTTSGATTNSLVSVTNTKAKFSLRPSSANTEVYVQADTLRLDAEL